MIEELITRVFEQRNAAHIAHWKTTNGEEHRALGSFYDDVDGIDKLVEARQGMFELIKTPAKDDMIGRLEADVLWISKNRATITGDIPAIQNLLDELTGTYLSTLYKLKNLR